MALLENREYVLTVDSMRSVSATPTDGGTVCLSVEDPNTVAIVEMEQEELGNLIDGLQRVRDIAVQASNLKGV